MCFPLAAFFAGTGSFIAIASALLFAYPESKLPSSWKVEDFHNGLVSLISSGGGMLLVGIYFFIAGVALVLISEHLRQKDEEKGYLPKE